MEGILEWFFKRYHGLGFAVAILVSLVTASFGMEDSIHELAKMAGLWGATAFFYWLGTYVDNLIYDPLFGANGIWKGVLRKDREAVKVKLHTLGWSTPEIQKISRCVFEHTRQWEKQVAGYYESSKALRTFVVPLLLLLAYEVSGAQWEIMHGFPRSALRSPWLIAILWLGATSAYLVLRIKHNRKLYRLVAQAEIETAESHAKYRKMLVNDEEQDQPRGFSFQFLCRRL